MARNERTYPSLGYLAKSGWFWHGQLGDAQGDTGQSRIVANFLLAWWNAAECGGFDLTDIWAVDTAIAADMVQVFTLIAACQHYPDSLGYGKKFEAIICAWRRGSRDSQSHAIAITSLFGVGGRRLDWQFDSH